MRRQKARCPHGGGRILLKTTAKIKAKTKKNEVKGEYSTSNTEYPIMMSGPVIGCHIHNVALVITGDYYESKYINSLQQQF